MTEKEPPKVEGIKYTGSRSEKVQNGVCFQTCEFDIQDVVKLVVPSNRCIFQCNRDKSSTKMTVIVNKVQNYWGFPTVLHTILESKDKMGIGMKKVNDTLQLCSFGSWVGGHEGGCHVIFEVIFPWHIKKITRRDELYGGHSCPEDFDPITNWKVDEKYQEIKFDAKSLMPSDICYERVEFMFSLDKFYPEVVNSRGSGVICSILSFLSVEDLMVSIPLVSKIFNMASKVVLLFLKNFTRNEYLYMLSYDYYGKTGLNEHELYEICKNNKNYDFNVSVPMSPEGGMDTLVFYFHKKFKNPDFLDLLLEKCKSPENVECALEKYTGESSQVEINVIEKLLQVPNVDPSGKAFLYCCMGGQPETIGKLLHHPYFLQNKNKKDDGYTTSSIVNYLIQRDLLDYLIEFDRKVKNMELLNVNRVENLHSAARSGAIKCFKHLNEKIGIQPTQETLNVCFGESDVQVEIVRFILKDPEFDPSSCLSLVLGSLPEEMKKLLTEMFISHPKVSSGSVLGAYASLGKDYLPKFKELLPKCTKEEMNQALLSGCSKDPLVSTEAIELLLKEEKEGMEFAKFVIMILKPPERYFWYEGVKFDAHNDIIIKILESSPKIVDDLKVIISENDEGFFVQKLVEISNIQLIEYFLGLNILELNLDLLTKVVANLYHDKEGIPKFFTSNFEKMPMESIDSDIAYRLWQSCYSDELRAYLLSKEEFMKKITSQEIFHSYAEDLEGMKMILEKVSVIPNEDTVINFCGRNAAARGLDVFKWMVEKYKLRLHTNNNEGLRNACQWGRGDFVEYLMKTDPENVDPSVDNNILLGTLLRNQYWSTKDCEIITKLFLADERYDPTVNDLEILPLSIFVSAECVKMILGHPRVRSSLSMDVINRLLIGCSVYEVRRGRGAGKQPKKVIEDVFNLLEGVSVFDIEKIDPKFLMGCVQTQVVETVQFVVDKGVKVTRDAILKAEELNKTEILEILVKNK